MIEYKECYLIYREENKNGPSILAMRDYQHIIFNIRYHSFCPPFDCGKLWQANLPFGKE
jgi:hypothetical protein